jgi:hypothetical protein
MFQPMEMVTSPDEILACCRDLVGAVKVNREDVRPFTIEGTCCT